MPTPEETVKMAAKIYETRDAAKLLYGEGYPALSEQYQKLLRAAMKKFNTDNVLTAVPRLVKETERESKRPIGAGIVLLLTAAAADMIDAEERR
jgi:triphosphoribosyl-dephospho-CoA synthetase